MLVPIVILEVVISCFGKPFFSYHANTNCSIDGYPIKGLYNTERNSELGLGETGLPGEPEDMEQI